MTSAVKWNKNDVVWYWYDKLCRSGRIYNMVGPYFYVADSRKQLNVALCDAEMFKKKQTRK